MSSSMVWRVYEQIQLLKVNLRLISAGLRLEKKSIKLTGMLKRGGYWQSLGSSDSSGVGR